MRLITIQPESVVSRLQAGHRMYGNPDFEADDSMPRKAYDWMVEQMKARLGWSAPEGAYPMWAWVVPTNGVKAFLPMTHQPGDYKLVLDVPDEVVVCSDYDLWHHVLNDYDIDLYEGEIIADRVQSWQRVFGVDPVDYRYTLESPDPSYMALDAPPTIQATMWYIEPAWIVSAEPMNKKEKLPDEGDKFAKRGAQFIVACLVFLFGVLIWGIRTETSEVQEFTADCKAVGGEVASMRGHLICVDPKHILKEQEHGDH